MNDVMQILTLSLPPHMPVQNVQLVAFRVNEQSLFNIKGIYFNVSGLMIYMQVEEYNITLDYIVR